ncbi:glycosyltransferase [uncultured Croceitalea sp.]|uniref:glycosyltransferase n=1 Tax=uncultured Croceitalea sp. TaxID=1798908 RepID=UPI00330674C7
MIIVIPCYNEALRLPLDQFVSFLNGHEKAEVLFVNDASTDDTLMVLKRIENQFKNSVAIISNDKNVGKAESVRRGVLHAARDNNTTSIAYLDADLATSLEECYSYQKYLDKGKKFVFASRILKIGSIVERKFSRFLAGRIIATFISSILDVKVYDTQCGCKVFTPEIAQIAFKDAFISKWLFDVEIFSRIIKKFGKDTALESMDEIPVNKWVDQGESKVKPTYFFKLWIDLYKIWKLHRA